MAIGLDLLKPGLEEEETVRFGEYLIPFVDCLLAEPPDPEEAKPDWNTATIGLVGAALLALVLRANGILDEERYGRALEGGRRRALLFLEKGHDGQGVFFEGPDYGSATVHYLSPLAFALARCGDRELVEHPGLARLVEGMAYEIVPGTGRLNPLNDCCGDSVNVSWLSLVAAGQGSGLAQWVWQRVQGVSGQGGAPEVLDWSDAVVRYLMYYDPTVEPVAPGEAGLARGKHFENRGLVDVRSGWGPDDALVSVLCDVYPAGGHRQADRNQFAFHALGESFAIDSGYGLEPLPDTTEVLRRGAMGEAHNLPLVHGRMQERGEVEGDGIVRLDVDGRWAYIESEAGHSYGPDWTFRRRIVALPGPDQDLGCLVVADRLRFTLLEPWPMMTWLLHTAAGNSVKLQRDRLTLIGARRGNCCDVQIATPWPGRWREEEFLDHPRLRYDWFYNSLDCLVVLVPYASGESPPHLEATGTAVGCGLEISLGEVSYTVLSAADGEEVSLGQTSTDAELALVGTRSGRVDRCMLSSGTRLLFAGEALVREAETTPYSASLP